MEGKELYRTRQQRKSLGDLANPPPVERWSADEDVLISALAQFVTLEEIFHDYLYLVSKKFRRKLIKLALVYQQAFIDDFSNRRWVWLVHCARIQDLTLEEMKKLDLETPSDVFNYYLSQPRTLEAVSEVERDIIRTLPSHPLFSLHGTEECKQNREKLKSVLLALTSAEPEVGYCQGMNFVAAILLLNLNMNIEDSFFMFLAIVREYHFKHLYSPSVPLLPLRMFTFTRLVRQHVPQVWHHLNSKTFSVEIFANQWIMTLFAYYLDPSILGAHIWTLFFLQGWKVVYQIGLAILALLEPQICAMDVEEISSFMATSRMGSNNHPFSNREKLKDDLLFAISKFRIKNSHLDQLANQFLSEKLMAVIDEELEDDQVSSARSIDEHSTSSMTEVESRSLGFSWLRSGGMNRFLRIDLASFATPNRPHEKLSKKLGFVNIPVPALRQIQRTLALVAQKSNKDMAATTGLLSDVERRLMGETKQFNALVVNATRMDEVFKEVTVRKAAMTEKLQNAVTEGRTDLRALMNEMVEIEREYDAKKEQRIELFDVISEQEDKLAKIGAEKTSIIVRISAIAAELEQTQNDVISRSILSAIDSFSNS